MLLPLLPKELFPAFILCDLQVAFLLKKHRRCVFLIQGFWDLPHASKLYRGVRSIWVKYFLIILAGEVDRPTASSLHIHEDLSSVLITDKQALVSVVQAGIPSVEEALGGHTASLIP